MKLRTFITISALVACGSFAEGKDSSGSDAGDPEGAGPHSGDAGGDAPVAIERCKGKLLIEENFAKAFNVGGWALTPTSTVTSDEAEGRPAPSLSVQVNALPSKAEVEHSISKQVRPEGQGIVCVEFDLRLEVGGAFTENAYGEVLEVRPDGDTVRSIFLEMRENGFALAQQSLTPTPLTGFRLEEWQHVVLTLPYSTNGTAAVYVDGQPLITGPRGVGPIPTTIDVKIGMRANARDGTTSAIRVNIDNVRMTAEP